MCPFPRCPSRIDKKLKLARKLLCVLLGNAIMVLPECDDVIMEWKADFQSPKVKPRLKQEAGAHQLDLFETYGSHEMVRIPDESSALP